MARFKNHLLVVIGFAIAGLIGAAFGTGTAQAIVSTLVSVVNPGTSPVHTSSVDVTDPGRIAYQSGVVNTFCVGDFCTFTFPPVPAGHRLVVQHVSASLLFDGTPIRVIVNPAAAVGIIPFFAPFVAEKSEFDQLVLSYTDSGTAPAVSVAVSGANFSMGAGQFVTLIGYELDCTVAPCAPIATQ